MSTFGMESSNIQKITWIIVSCWNIFYLTIITIAWRRTWLLQMFVNNLSCYQLNIYILHELLNCWQNTLWLAKTIHLVKMVTASSLFFYLNAWSKILISFLWNFSSLVQNHVVYCGQKYSHCEVKFWICGILLVNNKNKKF